MTAKLVLAGAVAAVLAGAAALWLAPRGEAPASARSAAQLEIAPLTIETAQGKREFRVELARTAAEQSRGLMHRRRMERDAGMLFVHRSPEVALMWMKNTYIPLDMLFIGADGRIARIAERTVPESEATISSGVPVIAVLELNGGTASRLGIAVGDRVRTRALPTGR